MDEKLREKRAKVTGVIVDLLEAWDKNKKGKAPDVSVMDMVGYILAIPEIAVIFRDTEPLIRKDEREKADKLIVEMIKEVEATMWGDDWNIRGVIYEGMLDKIVRKHRRRLTKATEGKEG